MKKLLLSLLLCSSIASVFAQNNVYKVGDIYPHPQLLGLPIAVFDGRLVFAAIDKPGFQINNGVELWTLDTSGSWNMHELNAGSSYSVCQSTQQIQATEANGKLFYCGVDDNLGNELHAWNGMNTPALAHDLTAGPNGSTLGDLSTLNGKIYFSFTTAGEGKELAVYDPVADAFSIKVLWPGSNSGYDRGLTVFNNMLFFAGRLPGSATNQELLIYDPANDTTYMIEINPGPAGSNPDGFVVAGGKIYFAATDAAHGRELYSIDAANTLTQLTDITAGNSLFQQEDGHQTIVALNNKLFFASASPIGPGQWLYQYDITSGTAATAVGAVNNITSALFSFKMATFNNSIYFAADDSNGDVELWVYDGVNAPKIMKNINPNTSSNPRNFKVFNKGLYFLATDGSQQGLDMYMVTDTSQNPNSVKKVDQNKARVYPNPVSDMLYVDLGSATGNYNATLTNIMGAVVQRSAFVFDGHGAATVHTNELPAGMYLYRIVNEKGAPIATGRILKQ